jgi:hypothetical protein
MALILSSRHLTDHFVDTTQMLNPNPMKTTPIDFRRWQLHIRKECVNCNRPDKSETIKPWSVNWTLLGRILQAKNA